MRAGSIEDLTGTFGMPTANGDLMGPSSSFEIATAVEQVGERTFQAVIPDEWQQGRGAFGGLVLGMLLRAILRLEPDAQRAARTLVGDISGPVLPGPADIQVRELRRGSNQSNFVAELAQGGAVLAVGSAVLSKARPSTRQFTKATPPPAEDWQSSPLLPFAPPLGPPFAQHYEYRLAGPWPFSGHPVPELGGWVREQTLLSRLDAPALIGRLDAWFPTLFVIESQPRPCATVQFMPSCSPIPLHSIRRFRSATGRR